jgi:hypothetical protein
MTAPERIVGLDLNWNSPECREYRVRLAGSALVTETVHTLAGKTHTFTRPGRYERVAIVPLSDSHADTFRARILEETFRSDGTVDDLGEVFLKRALNP